MPTYTPIIRYLLLWQLALPVLFVLTGIGWVWALLTMGLFVVMYRSQKWESNTYSRYGALAVVISSALYVLVTLISPENAAIVSQTQVKSLAQITQPPINTSLIEYVSLVVWLFSMIAFTATSPYPLGIRMPVVLYTVFYFLLGKNLVQITPMWILIWAAVVFAFLMLMNLVLWKQQSPYPTSNSFSNSFSNTNSNTNTISYNNHLYSTTTILTGPPEPPFSFSLATAIVLILVLAFSAGISSLLWHSTLLEVIPLILVSCILIWLLSAKDWKKNILAVSAIVLILTSNVTSIAAIYIHNQVLRTIAFILLVAPVVFHTTAPVFRGMRITITLYATYNAFCKSTFGDYFHSIFPNIPTLQTYAFIAFDAIVLVILILMALHWKRNQKTAKVQ